MYHKLGVLVALSAFFFVFIHSKGIGSFCFNAEECEIMNTLYIKQYICENSYCKCDENHIPDKNNKWCVVDNEKPCYIDETCYDSKAKCIGATSTTRQGTCECIEGFILHKKTKVCSAVIGNSCNKTDDCIEGTCRTGNFNYTQCFCNEPLQPNINGTKCLPGVNGDCSAFNDCADENSACNGKECLCFDNFKASERDNVTYCLAMLDNSCEVDTDCADIGAACVNATETEETDCCAKRKYSFLQEWSPEIDLPESYCACGEGYVRNPDISECLQVPTSNDTSCVHNIQCTTYSGFGSECVNGNCTCKESFYLDEDFNRCVRSCLCNDNTELNEIKAVLREIAPALEIVAQHNNMNISRALKRIKTL